MNEKLFSHPIYDRLPHSMDPPPYSQNPVPENCPDPLCLGDITDPPQCEACPAHAQADASAPGAQPSAEPSAQRPSRKSGWGGKRPGAGVKPGTMNRLRHGNRSALIRRAVELLAENPELRPFLLLIARAAVEGEIPQSTRQLIIKTIGDNPTAMLAASSQLRSLRDET